MIHVGDDTSSPATYKPQLRVTTRSTMTKFTEHIMLHKTGVFSVADSGILQLPAPQVNFKLIDTLSSILKTVLICLAYLFLTLACPLSDHAHHRSWHNGNQRTNLRLSAARRAGQ